MNSNGDQAALKALLGSIAPEGSNDNSKLTPEQLQKLSKKLDEILGEDKGEGVVNQNKQGEILNEDGLPIIDINEPLPSESTSATPAAGKFVVPEPPIVLPLWTLPSAELERRRAERDRILDLLEEEERLEAERDEEREEEERQKVLQKRRDAAGREISGLKAARDMQKQMGRALIRNMAEEREKEPQLDQQPRLQEMGEEEHERDALKPRKSVTFALPDHESPDQGTQPGAGLDWGDVIPARLKPPVHVDQSYPDSYGPMKTTVVERFPNAVEAVSDDPEKDSDDESTPPSPSVSSDEDHLDSRFDDLAQGVDDTSEEDGELEVGSEEFDLDTAQHQRQIALEYYEKRGKIGEQAAVALSPEVYNPNEDPWDQPEVPLEASVTGERPKPAISRFRADRIVASASTSLEGSLLPASQSHIIQRAVKTGKLEEGNLVGDEGDSDEEEMRAIMQLLNKAEVENIGPASQTPSMTPVDAQPEKAPAKPRNRTSRFKLARNVDSDLATPPSQDTRSSPKLPTAEVVAERIANTVSPSTSSLRSPVNATVRERTTPIVATRVQERGPKTPHSSIQRPTIIESPSFTSPSGTFNANSFIVNSPSFVPPSETALIIDSPSFQSPPGQNSRGTVMSENVGESVGPPGFGNKAKKVSRFAADRM